MNKRISCDPAVFSSAAPIYRDGPAPGDELCLPFDIGKLADGQPVWRLLSMRYIPVDRGGGGKLLAGAGGILCQMPRKR